MILRHTPAARRMLFPTQPSASVLFQAGQSGCLYDFARADGNLDGAGAMVTHGASLATAYDQRTGIANPAGITSFQSNTALRGLWVQDARGGAWRPDLADDVLGWTNAPVTDGEVFVVGRSGSWREPFASASGAAVAIGGAAAGTPATPGILRATGDVVAAGFRSGMMTEAEWRRLLRSWRSRGATGNLAPGGDLILNGGFDTDLSGWTASLGAPAWVSGRLRATASGGSVGRLWQQINGLTVGAPYLLAASCPAVFGSPNGVLHMSTNSGQTGTIGLMNVFPGTRQQRAYIPTAATMYVLAQCNGNTEGWWADLDDITLRPLTPEAL